MKEIRTKEGFEDFLRLPAAEPHLYELAGPGAIIIVETDPIAAGYALIITSDNVRKILLPGFTNNDAREHRTLMKDAIRASADEEGREEERSAGLLSYLLTWIWEMVAEPVMASLGYSGDNKDNELPCLWWLTSALGNFPIHAAGDHQRAVETGEPCTVLDRCIPSYTNTLRALGFVRRRETEMAQQEGSQEAMLVKISTTDHRDPLKQAAAEVDSAESVLREKGITTRVLDQPTRKEALQQLLKSRMAHLACHGEVDVSNPTRSGLLLRDLATKDSNGDIGKGNVLDVQSIMVAPTRLNCALVYLSACETAVTGDPKLPEESIHLAAAFQMAGVPCVVASLCKAEDETCSRLAK